MDLRLGKTVRNDSGRPVRILGISVDVTDHKKAEEERERLIAQELTARAQAEERRLSRELHDRVAHDIALVHQSLELRGPQRARPREVRSQARGGQEVDQGGPRIHQKPLHGAPSPGGQPGSGIGPLRSPARRDPPGASFEVSAEGDEAPVPAEARTQVFLILREAIRNAVTPRIAAALYGCKSCRKRWCALSKTTARVSRLMLYTRQIHNGLKSMEERASLLGGPRRLVNPGEGHDDPGDRTIGERDEE